MNLNKDSFVKIISIASLVVLGYIFFISVYNQIIVQSGGVFYVIIFGGILILAFVLLSLVTKLIEITQEIKDNTMWNVVEIVLLCLLSYLFLIFRMSYTSTIPAEETVLYRTALLMQSGELAEKGMDMVQHLCIYPSQYLYAFALSIFFRIGDAQQKTLIALNAFTVILNAFMIDRIVRKVAGRACGIIAAMCTVFIPSQAFAVYTYNSEAFFCFILFVAINTWLIVLKSEDADDKKQLIFSGLFGLSLAFLCFVEPLMIILAIALLIYLALKLKNDDRNFGLMTGLASGVFVLALILLIFIKTVTLGTDFGTVVSGGLSRFKLSRNIETSETYTGSDIFEKFHSDLDNQNTNVSDNYHFLEDENGESYTQTHNAWFTLGTQMSYMFVLVMSIACAYYMFRNKVERAIPLFVTVIVSFFVLFFRSTDEASSFFMFELLITTACCGLAYMYMNHHPELYGAVSEEVAVTPIGVSRQDSTSLGGAMEWGAIARARNLIFVKKEGEEEEIPDASIAEGGMADSMPEVPEGMEQAYQATPAPMPEPEPAREEIGQFVGGSVSPEGYFSFFNLSPAQQPAAPAPAPMSEPEPEPEVVGEYAEPVEEYEEAAGEYGESASDYEQPADEYTESVNEYEEPAEDLSPSAFGFGDISGDYSEPVEEYEEPVEEYGESVEEYGEPVEEYEEPIEEYEEPVEEYEEPAGEYEQPSNDFSDMVFRMPSDAYDGYGEPLEEYEEAAGEYAEEPDEEYEEAAGEYAEEPFEEYEEAAEEYSEPAPEYVQPEEYAQEPAYAEPAPAPARTQAGGNTTKASFTSAAHALGFSLSDDFFSNNTAEEPSYSFDEPVYDEAEYAEPLSDEPTFDYYADEEFDETPTVYDPTYEAGIDDFSFGEGMPDLDSFEEPAPAPIPAPAPAPAPKKKKVVRKVVKKVVKKPAPGEPELPTMDFRDDFADIESQFGQRDDLPTMQFRDDLSGIEEAFLYEDDYVDDAEIYDEPEDGNSVQGFTIEI